ncbi:hypothetical protein JHK82_012939 [Glycine max]|nr:hypothetical protein JHK85_013300 [Glycine max]KAG5057963.1 hypothetical protein JHK86_012959 [Glycine max]KAG5154970.1 hypothetical protein JHK82_012939 [Glycine max]
MALCIEAVTTINDPALIKCDIWGTFVYQRRFQRCGQIDLASGASVGGWMNDRFGRKITILYADALFFAGSVIMSVAPNSAVLVFGRVFLGLGVGMASMTSPLYISEASLTRVRGAPVSLNSFLITGGQFLSYIDNLGFTRNHPVGYSERESKKKVYKLRKIYPEGEVEAEIQNLRESTEMEITEVEAGEGWVSLGKMLKITCEERFICWDGHSLFPTVCGYQHSHVLQPHTIVQLAGFASNQTKISSPLIDPTETTPFNGTCSGYTAATNRDQWDCKTCLKGSKKCGFCAASDKLKPGACWDYDNNSENHCTSQHRDWYSKGCPSKTGFVAIIGLALYIMFFSPGIGTVSYVINYEIYPLRFRGVCGGMASTAVWVSNLILFASPSYP